MYIIKYIYYIKLLAIYIISETYINTSVNLYQWLKTKYNIEKLFVFMSLIILENSNFIVKKDLFFF